MTMQTFDTEQIFQFGPWKRERALVVKSGDVEVYVKNDFDLDDSDETSWTLDSSSYGVDTHFLRTINLKIKFVPLNGAIYSLDLNEEM